MNAMTVSVPFANSSVFIPGYNSASTQFLFPLLSSPLSLHFLHLVSSPSIPISILIFQSSKTNSQKGPDPSSLLPLAPYTPPTKGFLAPDLTDELQYSATYGHKHLIAWVKEHLTRMHNPKYDDWEVLLTAGNTDGTDGIMRACLDRGDYLLVEEFGMSLSQLCIA